MSSFIPLNVIEDSGVSKRDKEAEHTRELQVEQAYKTFDEAINLHKIGSLSKCYELYEDMFKIEVISNHYYEEEDYIKGIQNGGENTVVDELNFLSPNIKALRYLVFRNRAFLYLDMLRSPTSIANILPVAAETGELHDDEPSNSQNVQERSREMFYTMLDDMGIALIYQEADEALLQTLFELLMYISNYRLARYILEYTLSSKGESEDILGLLPVDKTIRNYHKHLVSYLLHPSSTVPKPLQSMISKVETDYSFLQSLRREFFSQVRDIQAPKIANCKIRLRSNQIHWEDIIGSINEHIKMAEDKSKVESTSRSKLKDIDPYFLSGECMDLIRIEIPQDYVSSDDDNEDETFASANDQEHEDEVIEIRDKSLATPEAGSVEVPESANMMLEETNEEESKDDKDNNGQDLPAEAEIGDEVQRDSPNSGDIEENKDASLNSTGLTVPDSNDAEMNHMGEAQKSNQNEGGEAHDDEDGDVVILKDSSYSPSKLKGSQRASKRLQKDLEPVSWMPDIRLKPNMFLETEIFFNNINSFLSKLNLNPSIVLPEIHKQFCHPETLDPVIRDFVEVLQDYQAYKHSDPLLLILFDKLLMDSIPSSDDERLKLLDVLRSFDHKSDVLNDDVSKIALEEYETNERVVKFVTSINEMNLHVNETKILILSHLLAYQDEDGTSLICDTQWPSHLMLQVKQWVLQLEEQIFQRSKVILFLGNRENIFDELSFSVGIFEILTDLYIQGKEKVDHLISQNPRKGFQKSLKVSLGTQTSEITKLKNILERWKLHIQDIFFILNSSKDQTNLIFKSYMRFKWACCYKEKTDNANFQSSKFISNQLQELANLARDQSLKLNIFVPMLNYDSISELHIDSILAMTNTITVLTLFAKIVYAKDEDNNEEAMYLLERTLISSEYFPPSDSTPKVDQEAITSIKNFLDNSNIEMRMNLWNILFLYYHGAHNFARFQFGLERFLESLFLSFKSEKYASLPDDVRHVYLLFNIGSFDEYLTLFLKHLADHKWKLPGQCNRPSEVESLGRFLFFFQMFYCFSLHEEAALITSRKDSLELKSKKAYSKLKSILLRISTITLIYYDHIVTNSRVIVPDHTIYPLFNLFHDQFGIRRLCDAGDRILLQMLQSRLLELDPLSHQNEILQIISCKYHLNISADSFSPANHDTESPSDLTKESALDISKLVLPLCIKNDPLKNIPKGDLKTIIDKFYEVIGDPEPDSSKLLMQNSSLISHFLDDTVINYSCLKSAFHGLLKLGIFETGATNNNSSTNSEIIGNGLYYLQGLLVLSSYKTRKKSMQGRSLELTNVVKLLTNDLTYKPERVESWLLLGQSFAFLVEDDLIWTSDKLNIIDRKVSIANLQRKSLLCYLMAISLSRNCSDSDVKFFVGELMTSFSQEFFNSITVPMDMLAFKVTANPQFIHVDNNHVFRAIELAPCINKSLCFKVLQQCTHLAIKSKPREWLTYYCLSKVQGKLDLSSDLVVNTLVEACKSCKYSHNIPEVIIEPHYRLCSVLYKYVKNDKLLIKEAMNYIRMDELFNSVSLDNMNSEQAEKLEFYKFIITCLKKIEHIDKKKWHHKYRYRLAKIYVEDFCNVEDALNQMNSIISLKPTSKSLILIWKPDNERPGKHFFYTFQYAMFYIDLLDQDKDLSSLLNMVPRLRKSNSTMISLNVCWEKLCSTVCKLIRHLFGIKDVFTENFLSTPFPLFLSQSKQVIEKLKQESLSKELEPVVCLLNSVNEMKKLNNGFGPTSLIDDTIVALFITIYNSVDKRDVEVSHEALPVKDSPNGKVKKVAKRDIFPYVTDILKNSKRDIDYVLKEKPAIFNDFVKDVEFNRNQSMNTAITPPPASEAIIVESSALVNSSQAGPAGPLIQNIAPKTESSSPQFDSTDQTEVSNTQTERMANTFETNNQSTTNSDKELKPEPLKGNDNKLENAVQQLEYAIKVLEESADKGSPSMESRNGSHDAESLANGKRFVEEITEENTEDLANKRPKTQ